MNIILPAVAIIGLLSMCHRTVAQDDLNMNSGFLALLETPGVAEFITLGENQKKEIGSIAEQFQKDADAIKADPLLSGTERSRRLGALRDERDRMVKSVLLDFQLVRLEHFPLLISLLEEGLANSLTNGSFALLLNLSPEERIAVREQSKVVLREFQEEMAAAQRRAISRLRDSLPQDRREKFDELLKPLLDYHGTLPNFSSRMLDAFSRSARSSFNQYGLPPLPDENQQ